MSSEAAFRFENVSKRFSIRVGPAVSLRGMLFTRRRRRGAFWALRDVTLDVEAGTTVGLIGGNGAGKSTLLRLAAGLSPLTSGRIASPRDAQSVLSLGANVDPTLTGRENAITALVVNGLTRRQAVARVEDVVEFSQLEDFIDSPVRTYSAGMTLRLAFGVAAQFSAPAFLVDEVLSVGDVRFQQRCLDHLAKLRDGRATILMASHDLGQVADFCDRVVWLQAGRVRQIGDAAEVVAAYRDAMRSETVNRTPAEDSPVAADAPLELRRNRFGSQELRIVDVRLNGGTSAAIETGQSLHLEAELRAAESPRAVILGVTIRKAPEGIPVVDEHVDLGRVASDQVVALELERLDIAAGEYLIDVGAYQADWQLAYDYHWAAYGLTVVGPEGGGPLRPPLQWRTADLDDPQRPTSSAGRETGSSEGLG